MGSPVWRPVKIHGTFTQTSESKAVVYQDHLYIIGGKTEKSLHESTILMLKINLKNYTSEIVSPNGKTIPSIRNGYSVVLWNHTLLLFGGWDGATKRGDLFQYDFQHNVWNFVHVPISPLPRSDHSAVVYKDYMFVYGGESSVYGRDTITNSFYKFDCVKVQWKRVLYKSWTPPPVVYHSAVVYGDYMYVYGGRLVDANSSRLFQYSFLCKSWMEIQTPSEMEGRRLMNTVVFENYLYVIGGSNGSGRFAFPSQMRFDFCTQQWEKLRNEEIVQRDCAAVVLYNEKLVLYGGNYDDVLWFGLLPKYEMMKKSDLSKLEVFSDIDIIIQDA
jgi:N-acetylneuraminic acid mutarotase